MHGGHNLQYPHIKATEFPEGYQLSWIAFKLTNKKERALFDNHRGKNLHYHKNGKETQPIMLYEQIVLDFPTKERSLARNKTIERVQIFRTFLLKRFL